ncbi:hypothetical protein BASA62_010357 [Batrachochytrium salamandrivorans]|nr:hypothetical protein BASA62_010357 [Batrachochytrium salamandrivorans]
MELLEMMMMDPAPPPPPLLSPEDIQKIIDHFFNQSDFSSANIASTIDRVKDGVVGFFENGEKAGKEIGGTAGPLLIRYLNRVIYVYVALIGWLEKEANTVFLAIKSALGDEEYYKIIREFVRTCIKLTIDAGRKEDKADEDISNIAKRIGTVIQNVGEIGTLFGEAFNIRIKFFDKLRSPLKDSASSKILYDSMSAMITSVDKFITDQQKIHEEIMKELKPPSHLNSDPPNPSKLRMN